MATDFVSDPDVSAIADLRRIPGVGPAIARDLLLLVNPEIVRNRRKIESAITNAQHFLTVQEQFGSFDAYIWQFAGGKPIVNRWRDMGEVPASTPDSDAMSHDLKERGFKFAGTTTICYAFMQATGMVNDHLVTCFRRT